MKNKKALKKISQILILAIMATAIFAACDEADADADTTNVETETAVLEEIEDTRIYPDLPEYDWDGYNFRILSTGVGGDLTSALSIQVPRDVDAEEETGEPLNDAVYYRNRSLEEKYNFTIEFMTGYHYVLREAVMSGDDYFDAVSLVTGGGFASTASKDGLLVDLFSIDHLDLTKPWWDQGFIENITLGGKLFFISGDSTLINRDSTTAMLFNKQMIEDFSLENPYELVLNNQWTLAKVSEMSTVVTTDLNGNGVLDYDIDRFGIALSLSTDFGTGAGVRYAEMGSDGVPVLIFGSERNFDAVYACRELSNADFCVPFYSTWVEGTGMESQITGPETTFASERALFFPTMIRSIERLRGDEVDFGIIPMPKYDESQKEWRHGVSPTFSQVLTVPNFGNREALARTGFILEAIAAESTYTTVPAWYDVQLTTKFARDAESKEMLDIIFDSVVWSPFGFYYWGVNFNASASARNGTLASDWARNVNIIEKEIQDTIKAFEKLD